MRLRFTGAPWYWRGTAPFHLVTVPEAERAAIKQVAGAVTYGWGMIPASVRIGNTEWTNSLWPKDGGYIVPIKQRVRDERLFGPNSGRPIAAAPHFGGACDPKPGIMFHYERETTTPVAAR